MWLRNCGRGVALAAIVATTIGLAPPAGASTRTVSRVSVNRAVVAVGVSAVITTKVSPALSGHRVYLQRYASGKWKSVQRATLGTSSRATFTVRSARTSTIRYRVYDPPAAGGFAASYSPTVAVRTVRALSCLAAMSISHPKRYSYTHVLVRTLSGARVHTVAHYKTTTTAHSARADRAGRADISYYISGATRGRPVPVTVAVTLAGRTATCATSFVPR